MSKKPSWFVMNAAEGIGTIKILGDIGGWGITFQDFNRQLESLGNLSEINLTINSDGGDVYQGFAIYNALAMHPATKNVTVMGLAASMASVIAMAGDSRNMPKNSVLMIHNPVGQIAGESDEIISFGEAVGAMRQKIAEVYSDASGGKLSKSKALSLMDKQSWLTADEALKYGLATNVIAPIKMAAKLTTRWGDYEVKQLGKKESTMSKEPTATDFEGVEKDTLTAIRADERKAIIAQQKEVNALCRVAGRPELAAKFNEDGKSVSEVVVELDKLGPVQPKKPGQRAASSEDEVSARSRIDTGDSKVPTLDSVDIWDRFNKRGEYSPRH